MVAGPHHRMKRIVAIGLTRRIRLLEKENARLREELERLRRVPGDLEQWLALFRAVAKGTTDAIYAKDLTGRYLLVNDAAATVHQRTAKEIVGKTDGEILPASLAEMVVAQDREVIAAGTTQRFMERWVDHPDGIARAWFTTKGPMRDGEGRIVGVFGISRDMSEMVRAQEALQQSEAQLNLMIEHAPIGMLLVDLERNLIRVNERFCEYLDRTPSELVGRNVREVTHPEDADNDAFLLRRLIAGEIPRYKLEKRYLRRDGSAVHTLLGVSLLRDSQGTPVHLIAQVLDITDRKAAEQKLHEQAEELRRLSLRDPLTGLYNRRGFMSVAEQLLGNAQRLGKRVTLVFVDVDRFKEINDQFGHEAGDRALFELASLLETTFRESDLIARLGGDEFAVAAMEVSPAEPGVLEARLEEAIARFNEVAHWPWMLAVSYGTAVFDPREPEGLDRLLREADRRMYERKRLRRAASRA